MTASSERFQDRRETLNYIGENPSSVQLERPTWERTTAGGRRRGTPQVLPPQTVRLVTFTRRTAKTQYVTQEGALETGAFTLIARWDADVQRLDEFTLNGNRYSIDSIEPDRSIRTVAVVTDRGVPDDGS